LHLGLYHVHDRPPFLSQFASWVERGDIGGAFVRHRDLHRESEEVVVRS
jgi:hypothetical protein